MKIAIVGSRPPAYDAPMETKQGYRGLLDKVEGYLWELASASQAHGIAIVSGGAKGVDQYAERYAEAYGFATEIYPADWNTHGKKAGFMRNQQIIDAADKVVAFWDGESKGTKYTIDLALKAKKNLEVLFPPGNGTQSQGDQVIFPNLPGLE